MFIFKIHLKSITHIQSVKWLQLDFGGGGGLWGKFLRTDRVQTQPTFVAKSLFPQIPTGSDG